MLVAHKKAIGRLVFADLTTIDESGAMTAYSSSTGIPMNGHNTLLPYDILFPEPGRVKEAVFHAITTGEKSKRLDRIAALMISTATNCTAWME